MSSLGRSRFQVASPTLFVFLRRFWPSVWRSKFTNTDHKLHHVFDQFAEHILGGCLIEFGSMLEGLFDQNPTSRPQDVLVRVADLGHFGLDWGVF